MNQAFALALACLGSVIGQAAPAERSALPGGLVLWQQHGATAGVSITALIRSGSFYESASASGRTAAMLHWMRLGGTRSLSAREVERSLAQLGAGLQVEVFHDRLVLRLRGAKQQFRPNLRLFADVLMSPAFERTREAVQLV